MTDETYRRHVLQTGIVHLDPDFSCQSEYFEGRLYVHLGISRFSAQVMRRIHEALQHRTNQWGAPFYAILPAPTSVKDKLVRSVGFTRTGYDADAEGNLCNLMKGPYPNGQH